jgi:hypothetical protein
MSNEQVSDYFQFHDKWAKSLKAITISPQINHLDQVRVEYNEDGTITERSTREWALSLKELDGITPALCDVVNGTRDQMSYLVSPGHFFHRHNTTGASISQDYILLASEKLDLETIYQGFPT